ncbi:DUF1559 domain-containing protein [Tundrisphaera sp. TA3]|uniref:DUF1559 family PulG-like putative transporter n=1 Tax=Tundrisphaera sp. TA3 TaxID=3435775 RepID=UPI003EBEC7F6
MIVALAGFLLAVVLMALPRGRETARLAGCSKNLSQIGVALQLYHQAQGSWPTVPSLGEGRGDAPVAALLDGLHLPDLVGLVDPLQPPKPSQAPARGKPVPGLTCPSDPGAVAARPAPTSYRATTGDTPSGQHGPFEPGRGSKSSEVEEGDGLSYTAGFAERLVGNGQDAPGTMNYAVVPGPIGPDGCPEGSPGSWRGDAGTSWSDAGWKSTLYNHVLPPNAPRSCLAEDDQTAAIGASSGHLNRINVLYLDGSVRGVTPSIDLNIWRGMATMRTPAAR